MDKKYIFKAKAKEELEMVNGVLIKVGEIVRCYQFPNSYDVHILNDKDVSIGCCYEYEFNKFLKKIRVKKPKIKLASNNNEVWLSRRSKANLKLVRVS